jgi:hypothetical protein
MAMSDDLRKLYRDLIEPELIAVHRWLADPDGGVPDGFTMMDTQSQILHLIEVDRRVTLLEAEALDDR